MVKSGVVVVLDSKGSLGIVERPLLSYCVDLCANTNSIVNAERIPSVAQSHKYEVSFSANCGKTQLCHRSQ